MDGEPTELHGNMLLDPDDTNNVNRFVTGIPWLNKSKKKSKKKKSEKTKSEKKKSNGYSENERKEVATRLLNLEKIRNIDNDVADFTGVFKPILQEGPSNAHQDEQPVVATDWKVDSLATIHLNAATTHSSVAPTLSSAVPIHSSGEQIDSSVAPTHSGVAPKLSSAVPMLESVPPRYTTKRSSVAQRHSSAAPIDTSVAPTYSNVTSTRSTEAPIHSSLASSENIQLQRPPLWNISKTRKVKRLKDISLLGEFAEANPQVGKVSKRTKKKLAKTTSNVPGASDSQTYDGMNKTNDDVSYVSSKRTMQHQSEKNKSVMQDRDVRRLGITDEKCMLDKSIKDTSHEIQLSKNAKKIAHKEGFENQNSAVEVIYTRTGMNVVSNEHTKSAPRVILSKSAKKKARSHAINDTKVLSGVNVIIKSKEHTGGSTQTVEESNVARKKTCKQAVNEVPYDVKDKENSVCSSEPASEQLSKKAKRREEMENQNDAGVKCPEINVMTNKLIEKNMPKVLSKKARKRMNRHAICKTEIPSNFETTATSVKSCTPTMEHAQTEALPRQDWENKLENQPSSSCQMTDLKEVSSSQGALPVTSSRDVFSAILLGRGFSKLTPPGINTLKAYKTSAARKGFVTAGGMDWGVHNTKNGSVPRAFSMQTAKTCVFPSFRIVFLTNGYWMLKPCAVRHKQSNRELSSLSKKQEALLYKHQTDYPDALVDLDGKHQRKGKDQVKFTRLRSSTEKRKRRRDCVDKHVQFWCPGITQPIRNRGNNNKRKRPGMDVGCTESTNNNSCCKTREIVANTEPGTLKGIQKNSRLQIIRDFLSADTKSHPHGANKQIERSSCTKQSQRQAHKTKRNVGHGLHIKWCHDKPVVIGMNPFHKSIYLIHDNTRSRLLETEKTLTDKDLNLKLRRNLEVQSQKMMQESKDNTHMVNQVMSHATDNSGSSGKRRDTASANCSGNPIGNKGCEVEAASRPEASKTPKVAAAREKKQSPKKSAEAISKSVESKKLQGAEKKANASSAKKATVVKKEIEHSKEDFHLFEKKHFGKTESKGLTKQTTPKKKSEKKQKSAKTGSKKSRQDDSSLSTRKTLSTSASSCDATATSCGTSALGEKLLVLDAEKQRDLQTCLQVNGINETDDENTTEVVLSIATALKIKLDIKEIEHSARMGSQSTGKSRGIFVKFKCLGSRQKLYKKRNLVRSLPDYENVFINETLTPRRMRLFFEARELRRSSLITRAWTENGEILVKDNDSKQHTIVTETDLDQFRK